MNSDQTKVSIFVYVFGITFFYGLFTVVIHIVSGEHASGAWWVTLAIKLIAYFVAFAAIMGVIRKLKNRGRKSNGSGVNRNE